MSNTEQHLPSNKPDYTDLPENYLSVPKGEIDAEALRCVVARAKAISAMLSNSLFGGGTKFNRDITANAYWALEGLLDQAQILLGDRQP